MKQITVFFSCLWQQLVLLPSSPLFCHILLLKTSVAPCLVTALWPPIPILFRGQHPLWPDLISADLGLFFQVAPLPLKPSFQGPAYIWVLPSLFLDSVLPKNFCLVTMQKPPQGFLSSLSSLTFFPSSLNTFVSCPLSLDLWQGGWDSALWGSGQIWSFRYWLSAAGAEETHQGQPQPSWALSRGGQPHEDGSCDGGCSRSWESTSSGNTCAAEGSRPDCGLVGRAGDRASDVSEAARVVSQQAVWRSRRTWTRKGGRSQMARASQSRVRAVGLVLGAPGSCWQPGC